MDRHHPHCVSWGGLWLKYSVFSFKCLKKKKKIPFQVLYIKTPVLLLMYRDPTAKRERGKLVSDLL